MASSQIIIEVLRGMLESAQRGEFIGIAIATASRKDIATVWALDGASSAEMIGAVAVLQYRLIAAPDE